MLDVLAPCFISRSFECLGLELLAVTARMQELVGGPDSQQIAACGLQGWGKCQTYEKLDLPLAKGNWAKVGILLAMYVE